MEKVNTYKTPLRYVGGKTKLADVLIPMFPDHTAYVEPFGGGGGVLFNKPVSQVEVLNDFDRNLVNFWRVLQNNPKELADSFKYLPASREIFDEYKEKYNRGDYASDIERAHIYYYLNRNCFGGDMKCPGFGINKTITHTYNPLAAEHTFMQAFVRVYHVIFEHLDFEEVLIRYDGPDTFFFIDPPYRKVKDYNTGHFSDTDYTRMRDRLLQLEGKFLLTVNEDSFLKDLFGDFDIITHTVHYDICRDTEGRRSFGEMIIRNYEKENQKQYDMFDNLN